MKLHSCTKCGGPRRSLQHDWCGKCRELKHPMDQCPTCPNRKKVSAKLCRSCHMRAVNAAKVANGRKVLRMRVYQHGHPRADAKGRVLRSLVVFEEHWGRPPHSWEIVHHMDCNPCNDDPYNLVGLTESEHRAIHGAIARNFAPAPRSHQKGYRKSRAKNSRSWRT